MDEQMIERVFNVFMAFAAVYVISIFFMAALQAFIPIPPV